VLGAFASVVEFRSFGVFAEAEGLSWFEDDIFRGGGDVEKHDEILIFDFVCGRRCCDERVKYVTRKMDFI
jgi:hypothetical protein